MNGSPGHPMGHAACPMATWIQVQCRGIKAESDPALPGHPDWGGVANEPTVPSSLLVTDTRGNTAVSSVCVYVCVTVCMQVCATCACAYARVFVCMCACMCVQVCARVCVSTFPLSSPSYRRSLSCGPIEDRSLSSLLVSRFLFPPTPLSTLKSEISAAAISSGRKLRCPSSGTRLPGSAAVIPHHGRPARRGALIYINPWM